VADYVRNKGLFPHWKIDTNVVNFRDLPDRIKSDGAFAGYQSAGYIVYNPDTHNYFVDKATKFWKELLLNEHYKIPEVTRFGNRTLIFIPTVLSFDEINKRIFETFIAEKARSLLGGKETDLMFVVETLEENFNMRIQGGPIHENEAINYISFSSEHFKKCGLFLDIDYSKTKDLDHNVINKLLHDSITLTWNKAENIAKSLGI
jgi:hypothetical protein